MLLMLTGQRVQEICTLHKDQYLKEEGMIDWATTKNGKPHAIPLPGLAIELLDSLTPNEHGWFFPGSKDPSQSVQHTTLYSFLWRQRDRGGPHRHQPRHAAHLEDPGRQGWAGEGDPRPTAEPHPAGRVEQEL